VEDNAEAGSGLWQLSGFTLSTARYHSSSHSYYSTTQGNNQVTTMKSNYPYLVEPGDSLTYWCWYSIETEWDYAFVEVSRDGREWDLLASYTGSQSTWVRKANSLANYVGEWIFIQFRYITDDNTVQTGFNVDDISPVPDFGSAMVLATNITDNFFDITGRPRDIYYYRVKGYNSARGWGDFGQYEDVDVRRGLFHRVAGQQ
jgi:bacillopeptidase F (M6 metalloprotease family)